MPDSRIYSIALTLINGVGDITARQLLQVFGDAEAVFREKRQALSKVPGVGEVLAKEIAGADVLRRAEQELLYMEQNGIIGFSITDKNYPFRLRECPDAPVYFYYKGAAELNNRHIISIVGTRKSTPYGRQLTEELIADLQASIPDLLVVSGLAYGIDVCAHRAALKSALPTVGVLAHGLDRLYPASHRDVAAQMLDKGGLLTDFPSGTNPDRPNFLKRNRLIAGLSDATIVVESAERGGSLVTADIAFSYGRDVFAFPGKVSDPYSKGCNRLIRTNKAGLITSAEDLIRAMCWDQEKEKARPQQLSFDFSEESSHPIAKLLREKGDLQINQIALALELPIHQISTQLFELEMNGIVRALPGSVYQIV